MFRFTLLVVLLSALRLSAATFVVDSPGDASDASPGNGVCATASNDCTLRAAIEEANALAGADAIHFAIAGTILPASLLPAVTDTVTIDGTTAPGFAGVPLVFLGGSDTVVDGLRFLSGSSGSTLRALQVTDFTNDGVHVRSSGVSIVDNALAGNGRAGLFSNGANELTMTGNRVGLTAAGAAHGNGQAGIWLNNGSGITVGTPGEGNTISGNITGAGIRTDRVSLSTIEANLIGLAPDGTTARPNRDGMILHRANRVSILGNVISANAQVAIIAELSLRFDIAGNRIGTDVAGTIARPNNNTAVALLNVSDSDVRENVISGNATDALLLSAPDTARNRVFGNIIGRNAANTAALPNGRSGIRINNAFDNVIGSVELGGNVIANNAHTGVEIESGSRNTVVANSMFDNFTFGLDLLPPSGVTPNDDGDGDTGANELQNFPELDSASFGVTETRVTGTLNSTPNTLFTIHFYSESDAPVFQHGQGETYLAAIEVTTDALGNASFTVSLPPVPAGEAITATATGAASGTSEFSLVEHVAPLPEINFSETFVLAEEGAFNLRLGLTRSDDVFPATVQFTVTAITAEEGSDYAAATGTVTFAPGERLKDLEIPLLEDSADELDETFVVTLHSPTLATVGERNQATVTIKDDDVPALSIADVTDTEGDTSNFFTFTVSLSVPAVEPVEVSWGQGLHGTALEGIDYEPGQGTLTFAPGETTKTFDIEILGDTTLEVDEDFFIFLFNEDGAVVADNEGRGVILDDDPAPSISVSDVTEVEGDDGFPRLLFVVSLSQEAGVPVSIDFATADGTATASDYTAVEGHFDFAPGANNLGVSVSIVPDTLFEQDETVLFTLSNPENAVIADGEAVGTIANDDLAPAAAAAVPTVSEWALIIMGLLLAAVAASRLTR